MNQKLLIRKKVLEQESIESGVKKSTSAKERDLESQIKKAVLDLESVQKDIERINSYKTSKEGE